MMLTSLLAASALASQAAAFLVPLEVANNVKTSEADLHLSFLDTKSQEISIKCQDCWFDTANDHQADYSEQPENTLALNFTINDSENTLTLNGQALYPLESPFTPHLYASLVRSANSVWSSPLPVGFALEYLPVHESADEDGTIIPLRLSIVDLEGVPVKVPTVATDLIKLSSGELMIAKVDTIPFEESPGQECTNSFCRAKAMALAHLREMMEGAKGRVEKAGEMLGMKAKGCGAGRGRVSGQKKPGHKARPHGHGERPHEDSEQSQDHGEHSHEHGERPHEQNERPHAHEGKGPHQHHHPHAHAHGHRHHGKIQKFVHRVTRLFIIPALLGVIGGLTASALGMMVGQTIVFLWVRFVRGGHRGTVSSARLNEAGFEEEKEALVGEEDVEGLPTYEEAETVTDEKN